MMSISTTAPTLQAAAADALVRLLPSTTTLLPVVQLDHSESAGQMGTAVVASFVGEVSADVALVLTDTDSITVAAGLETPSVSIVDVLRPALEAATGVLGTGVLGDVREEDASSLFDDRDTVVFELSGTEVRAGWFAIRIRQNILTGASPASPTSVIGKLGRINNVEMALTVEIGRTRMSVRDVLALEPGAVIELDRSAGAPADVLLNGRLIAHGEVVVVDQDYAIRITKILDVAEGFN